jgi:c-di-GMP-binding flagellar brake protein YcgR
MDDRRKYQRYVVSDNRNIIAKAKIKVEGESVHLVDFSVGGLCVLSQRPFSSGIKRISVEFIDRGKIELYGRIVREKEENNMWRVGIDFTETYKLGALRKA